MKSLLISLLIAATLLLNNSDSAFAQQLEFSTTTRKFIQYNAPIMLTSPLEAPQDTSLVAFSLSGPSAIILIDWKSGTVVDSIWLYKFFDKSRYFTAKNYVNKDTICIATYALRGNTNHDSTMLIVNQELDRGRQFYPGQEIPVINPRNPVVEPDSLLNFDLRYTNLAYANGNVFGIATSRQFDLGDSLYARWRPMLAGHWQPENGEYVFKRHPVWFPEWVYQQPYACSNSQAMRRAINHKGNPVYAFEMTPEYVEYDMASGETRSYRAPSALLDTVRPVPLDENGAPAFSRQFNEKEGSFFQFYFDPWRKQYIRLMKLPTDSSHAITNFNKKGCLKDYFWRYAIGVLDTNFHLVGEGVLPEALQPKPETTNWPRMIVRPDGLYFYDHPATETAKVQGEKGMVFTRLDWSVSNDRIAADCSDARGEKARIPSGDCLDAYLKDRRGLTEPDLLVLLTPARAEGAALLLDYYGQFRKEYPDKPFYLVVVAGEDSVANELLNRARGLSQADPFLKVDARNDLKRFAGELPYPRLLIYQNGVKHRDYNLPPAEIGKALMTIEHYFGVDD